MDVEYQARAVQCQTGVRLPTNLPTCYLVRRERAGTFTARAVAFGASPPAQPVPGRRRLNSQGEGHADSVGKSYNNEEKLMKKNVGKYYQR